jgi:hypothetical protein
MRQKRTPPRERRPEGRARLQPHTTMIPLGVFLVTGLIAFIVTGAPPPEVGDRVAVSIDSNVDGAANQATNIPPALYRPRLLANSFAAPGARCNLSAAVAAAHGGEITVLAVRSDGVDVFLSEQGRQPAGACQDGAELLFSSADYQTLVNTAVGQDS